MSNSSRDEADVKRRPAVPNLTPTQLTGLLTESASDKDLPEASRRLAARMTVLSKWVDLTLVQLTSLARRHETRLAENARLTAELDAKYDALIKELEAALTEAPVQEAAEQARPAEVDGSPPGGNGAEVVPAKGPEDVAQVDDSEALSLAERMRAESDAEAAAAVETQALGDAARKTVRRGPKAGASK